MSNEVEVLTATHQAQPGWASRLPGAARAMRPGQWLWVIEAGQSAVARRWECER